MKTALLVIDFQNDYFPGGKNPAVNALEAAQNAYMLLQCFRDVGGHHIHIQHVSLEPDAAFLVKGDRGSDIHDSVVHFEGEPIVYKHYANSFRETNLLEMLREWETERVVICGMVTQTAVDATVRAAAELGFQVLVAEDACAAQNISDGDTTIPAKQVHQKFLEVLRPFGRVMKSETILAYLAAEQANIG